ELENQLTTKSKTLDDLKQSLAVNGSAEQTPEALSLRIAELCEMVGSTVNQVAQLKTSMQSTLEQWRLYDEVYAEFSLMTTRYSYCMDQCKPVVSLEALRRQVKTLQ
ncbi:SYNE2 protein, partial [Syrrhaptes paradoxus]|nr:SYNE2 protein [Syrrhaptes paradoxus]